jgi:carboxypeptidase Taq
MNAPASAHQLFPNHRSDLDAATAHARQTAVLASVESLLGWDEQTMLPPEGGGYRADQVAAVATLVHAARTDPAQCDRLRRLEDAIEGGRDDGWSDEERATVRRLLRDLDKHIRLPARLVEETARACIDGQQAWVEARRHSDWKGFAPKLERIITLKREQAICQSPDLDPYDALLDDYEPGARSSDVSALFDRLRPRIVQLVRACCEARDRPDDALLRRDFPRDAQERFVRTVAERIGFDFRRGRLDTSEHPFCSTNGPHDCRLTTRWDEAYLPTSLFGVLHEAGHGLYEQGLRVDAFGLPAGEAASLGVHESQSRLWENLVGRSLPFWEWCLPLARQAFPASLSDSSPERIQRALLSVRPSLVRVEADEVTYNLHVMLRFDLERALVCGDLAVADLPSAWDDRCESDFGIRPANAAEGVLQDIHWSAGLIGYFPTYTLGNVYAAQMMAAIERDLPDLSSDVAAGRFETLLGWLRRRVHHQGRLLDPGPLLQAATGMPVSERWLLESLWHRYGPAHGVGQHPPS